MLPNRSESRVKSRPKSSPAAIKLFHDGCKALSRVECRGVRIDRKYLNSAIKKTKHRIDLETQKLLHTEEGKAWKKRFGTKINLTSRQQLQIVLFDVLGHKRPEVKKGARAKADKAALETLDLPFVKDYLHVQRLQKALGTYLLPIKRETTSDGFAHVFYQLNKVKTFRGSSDAFNFQNQPVRDPEIAEIIRRCFIARDGHQLVEIDYSGIEVCIAACYNKDPILISYIKDKTKDMHRDMAAECFGIQPDQVSKMARYAAKNMFVFPQFYGSFWRDCAPNLWNAISTFKLDVDGVSLRKLLAEQHGIHELGATESDWETGRIKTEPGTFMDHIRLVEENFWGERFKVYAEWKKRWFAKYLERGYFRSKTGFVCDGPLFRNDVINYPVQGSAFHCLLKSLIEIERRTQKMRSGIVGQIHDSMLSDVHEKELDEYLHLSKYIMTEWLPSIWDWIIVPLSIEADVAPIGGSWFEKKAKAI